MRNRCSEKGRGGRHKGEQMIVCYACFVSQVHEEMNREGDRKRTAIERNEMKGKEVRGCGVH